MPSAKRAASRDSENNSCPHNAPSTSALNAHKCRCRSPADHLTARSEMQTESAGAKLLAAKHGSTCRRCRHEDASVVIARPGRPGTLVELAEHAPLPCEELLKSEDRLNPNGLEKRTPETRGKAK